MSRLIGIFFNWYYYFRLMTQKMKNAGLKATGTTNESEKYCAVHIMKKIGGKYFLHGNPDITFFKNGKFSFYEVKPYLHWLEKKKHHNWRLTARKQRELTPDQTETFRQMIKSGIDVWIIYYNVKVDKKNNTTYTIHDEKALTGKCNPVKVTEEVLRNSDPADYFEYE